MKLKQQLRDQHQMCRNSCQRSQAGPLAMQMAAAGRLYICRGVCAAERGEHPPDALVGAAAQPKVWQMEAIVWLLAHLYAEAGTRQHGEGHAVLGARCRVQDERHQCDGVAQKHTQDALQYARGAHW